MAFFRDDRPKLGRLLGSASLSQRISWASGQQTTRIEGMAYCLLGILDISMPLLYGESDRTFTVFIQALKHTGARTRLLAKHMRIQRSTGVKMTAFNADV